MVRSLRARLTLWYAGVLAVVLAGAALAGWTFVARTTLARTDEYLFETAGALAGALEVERRERPHDDVIPDVVDDYTFRDIAVAVLDPAGRRLVRADTALAGPSTPPALPRLDSLLAHAPPAGASFLTVGPADDPVRVLALPYALGGRRLVIGTARSLQAQARTLREARLALAVGIPLLLLVAASGGLLLAAAGLRPVADMAARAQRIGAATLHERLPVRDPRDELGRLATAFNDLLERLEGSFEQQRAFMADASHELRTPVAVVSGEAELALARDDRSPERLRDALEVVRGESRRLGRIVEDLFVLARANAGEQVVRREPLYLDDVVADSVRAARTLAAERGVALSADVEDDLPLAGDETLLRRLVMNLVDNALKYTPSGGRVTVRAARRDDAYAVTVEDTGPGIPEDARARVFERFVRAAPRADGAPPTGGAGLGLAIARFAARAHGGELALRRSDASGSVFEAVIPTAVNSEQ